ncbi:MAG: sigma-E factor negative regulatory protein [Rhizobacter sp.]
MQELSSLMDGELDSSAVAKACREWKDDAQVRSEWHAYHLIGDVLRSEDLASTGSHDAAFLVALRGRLAEEPVVLAPSRAVEVAEETRARGKRSWATPMAVAAGFAVVAGSLVVTQMAGGLSLRGSQGEALVAKAPAAPPAVVLVDSAASAAVEQRVVLNGQLVRDVRLDEYLAAHKKFGGSSLPGGPSGFLRNASAEVPAR